MKEPQQPECGQDNCSEPAVASYFWPGRSERSFVCKPHLDKAVHIAGAMGFFLGDLRLRAYEDDTE